MGLRAIPARGACADRAIPVQLLKPESERIIIVK